MTTEVICCCDSKGGVVRAWLSGLPIYNVSIIHSPKDSLPLLLFKASFASLSSNLNSLSPEQPRKALASISSTLPGIDKEAKLLHPMNAFCPIVVTPSGMIIDFNWLQFIKAHKPIALSPLKYRNSSNDEMVAFSLKGLVLPRLVTAAASSSSSSPSPFVSQFATHIALTLASAKVIIGAFSVGSNVLSPSALHIDRTHI